MAQFVHLAPEAALARIRRTGIAAGRLGDGRGIHAMPVTPDFMRTHQWLRELARFRRGPLWAVYFHLADDEPVHAGRYNAAHAAMPAGEAARLAYSEADAGGLEVIVGRRIAAGELGAIRRLPQTVGWRYFPEAKGRPPFCPCRYCQRGLYGSRRLRSRLGAD